MSALAMILTAAMVVPGDGPEKVSGEIVRERQPLNLKGEWKAVVYHYGSVCKGKANVEKAAQVPASDIQFVFRESEGGFVLYFGDPVDEGGGNFKMGGLLGIYEQDGDRLRICLNDREWDERPTSFHASENQRLFILHRVKSRK